VRSAQEKGLAGILEAVLATTRKTKKSKARMLDAETAYNRVKKFLARQGSVSTLGSLSAFEKRYHIDANLQNVVADIDQVERKIAEAVKSRDYLQSLIEKMYSGNKQLKFMDQSIRVERLDGRDIGLVSLSSGEKHLLRIFLETLLVGESSIMIDEPEISMHVDWQNELIPAMRTLNPSAQLILATHSPEIMTKISDDKIFNL
jgi:predicted ATPase